MPGVEIAITARDNASATLQNVKNQLVIFDQFGRTASDLTTKLDTTTRAFGGMDISVNKLTRGVRGLAVPLVSELSPALGATASGMGQVVSSALLLGSGLRVVALVAGGLAGVLGGKLVQSYRDAKEAAERWARAVELSDVAALTAGVEKEAEAVRKLAKELRELEEAATRARPEARGGGPEAAGIAAAHEAQVRSSSEAAREAKRRELEQAERDLEGARAAQSIGASFADMTKPWLAASETLTKIRQAEDAALKKIRAEFEKFSDAELAPGTWGFSGAEFAQARAAVEGSRERDIARERATNESMAAMGEIPTSMGLASGDVERVGTVLAKLDQDRIRLRREEIDILRETATLQLEAVGLSREETRAIEEGAIARQHALEIEIAGDDQAKQRLADLRAGTGMQRIAERDEALPGLLRGIDDVERSFGSAGLRMQEAARDVGQGIYTNLSDAMFGPIEARMAGLPPLFRGILSSMLRAGTDLFAKEITAQLFGGVKSLFPGGSGAGNFSGGGSGGGPLLTTAGRPLSQSEISTAYEAGGDPGVRALQQGRATVVGGEFITESGDLPGFSTGPSGMVLTPSSPGFTFRQGAGIAGSAALLGLTAFGARGAQTNFDVGTSAAMGALTGAQLGASVGSLFNSSGTGAGVGALAGAAIAGTIAALAKAEADKVRAKARQAAEIERAAGAGTDLVRSAASSTSISDFYRRVTAFGSGTSGGTSSVAVPVSVMTETGEKAIGVPNAQIPTATLQELLAAPGSLRAGIQAGVDPASLMGPNLATSTALQAIARDLVDQFREAEMGVGLTQEDRVGGLTRRTTFPASRADMLDPNLGVEIDELALAELDPDDRALLMLETMSRVAVEQDFVSTISDGATGQIVSITRIARSTIPLPPGTPGPPPGVPPAAIPAIGAAAALNIPQFTEPAPRGAAIMGPGGFFNAGAGEGGTFEPGPDVVVGFQAPTAEQTAAYQARRAAFFAPFVEQLGAQTKEALSSLSAAQLQAAINAGLLTPAGVASLVQAGLLPQLAAVLPPEILNQIGELQIDPGGGVSVGLPAGVPSGAVDFASLPPGTFSEAALQGLIAVVNSASWGTATQAGLTPASNLSYAQNALAFVAGFGAMVAGVPMVGTLLSGVMAALNVIAGAVAGNLAAQSGFADAFVGGQAPSPPTTEGLTFAQQLSFAAQGVPFVSDPTAPTGYSVDPTFGFVDANGNIQGFHTAGNPSGLPTNPDATNFGAVPEASFNTNAVDPTFGEPGGAGGGAGK